MLGISPELTVLMTYTKGRLPEVVQLAVGMASFWRDTTVACEGMDEKPRGLGGWMPSRVHEKRWVPRGVFGPGENYHLQLQDQPAQENCLSVSSNLAGSTVQVL